MKEQAKSGEGRKVARSLSIEVLDEGFSIDIPGASGTLLVSEEQEERNFRSLFAVFDTP